MIYLYDFFTLWLSLFIHSRTFGPEKMLKTPVSVVYETPTRSA
jgi:hypothetical protein